MFRFDNLVGVSFNEEGKAKLKKYEHTGLYLGIITFFVIILMNVSLDTQMFSNFLGLLSSFSISNYIVVPFFVAFFVWFGSENRIRYHIIKKYGKVIEYSVEMRIEDEGIYVTYLNDNLEVFFRREDLYIDITDEPKSIRKYLKLKDKSFVELSFGDYEIKIPFSKNGNFYGDVLDRYPEHAPDYDEDDDDE